MPRKKARYFYNTHTLKYEPLVISWKQRLKKWFGQGMMTITLTGIILLAAYYLIDSPKEKELKREISQLKFEYELLNQKSEDFEKVLKSLQDRDDNMFRVIFEAEPIPAPVREAGYGGANKYKDLEFYENADLMISAHRRLDRIGKQLYIQSKSYDEIARMIKNKSDMMASIPAIQPIANNDLKRIASGFGNRIHPFFKTPKMHWGLDFTAPPGTEIHCTGNGIVSKVAFEAGYGKYVIVDHGFGYETLYAHMKDTHVKKGQQLKRGDVLGTVGNTGLSMAPHLHYEVIRNGQKIDPINYFYNDLTAEEYEMVIELARTHNQSYD